MDELVSDIVSYLAGDFGCIELFGVNKRFSLLLRQMRNSRPFVRLPDRVSSELLFADVKWWMYTEAQLKSMKRWVPAWRTTKDKHNRQVFEIFRSDVEAVYALWFNEEVPTKITIEFGGNVVDYTMFGRRLWDAHVIPTGDVVYYKVRITLPEGYTFENVEVFASPYCGSGYPRNSVIYPARWYSDSIGTQMYNLLLSSGGMLMWKIHVEGDKLGVSFSKLVDLLRQTSFLLETETRIQQLAKILDHDLFSQTLQLRQRFIA